MKTTSKMKTSLDEYNLKNEEDLKCADELKSENNPQNGDMLHCWGHCILPEKNCWWLLTLTARAHLTPNRKSYQLSNRISCDGRNVLSITQAQICRKDDIFCQRPLNHIEMWRGWLWSLQKSFPYSCGICSFFISKFKSWRGEICLTFLIFDH